MLRIAALFMVAAGVFAMACGGGDISGLPFACVTSDQCSSGWRCWRGVCTTDAAFDIGTTCQADDDCATRACVGGICCTGSCDGGCEACDLPGSVGQCQPIATGAAGSPACAPYLCDGVSGTCPTACLGDSECAPAAFCSSGQCAAMESLGGSCDRARACDSGFCVDGRCCESACGAPCDACDVPGQEGLCRVAPLGRIPSPSCGGYACKGTGTGCPANCTSDAGCVSGFNCGVSRSCQPRLETLVDTFNDGIVDTGLWSSFCGTYQTEAEQNGRLEIRFSPWSMDWCGYTSVNAYDPTESHATVALLKAEDVSAQGVSSPNHETYFFIEQTAADSSLNAFGFEIYGGNVHATKAAGGTWTNLFTWPYNSVQDYLLRFRVSGATVYWETSADGGTFVPRVSGPTAAWMQSTVVEFGAIAFSAGDAGSLAIFDDFNP